MVMSSTWSRPVGSSGSLSGHIGCFLLRARVASLGYARLYPGRITHSAAVHDGPAAGLLARGNGAMLQRRVHGSTGGLAAVVRNAVSHTLSAE